MYFVNFFKMKKYNSYRILLVFLALIISCFLQVTYLYAQPSLEWIRQYPDTNTITSVPFSLVVDDFGNVYTTGHTEIGTWNCYTTIKYNSSGVQQWAVNFFGDTAGGRTPYDIAVDKQLNVYVAGYAYTRNTNYFDFCTVKYDSNGVQQWVRYYDNPSHYIDEARKIAVDSAGNVYVSGTSELCLFSCRIYTIIKYSTTGEQIWYRTYGSGTPNSCEIGDMKIDNDCNVYITGVNGFDAITVKYDSSGNQIWDNIYTINSNIAIAKSMVLDKDNNVIIAGQGVNGDRYSSFTIKYNSSGIQRWANLIRPTSLDTDSYRCNSLVCDNAGNIYISGLYQHNAPTPRKMFLVKYSSAGDSLWSLTGTDSVVPPNSYLYIDNKDNIYALITKRIPPNQSHIVLLKFDNSGTLKWKEETDFPSSASGLKVDKYFNIYLSGYSNHKITTIKYSQITGVKIVKEILPNEYLLYQNYPNPFNPSTKIKFDLPVRVGERYIFHLQLKIYDVLGKEIAVLVNQQFQPGIYEVEWDASNYPSGVYFYKLKIDDFTETKKMVLIK
jgi:hypothetical protein